MKKAAYAEWDPEVLDSYLKYALYDSDVEGEGVRLKTDRFSVCHPGSFRAEQFLTDSLFILDRGDRRP